MILIYVDEVSKRLIYTLNIMFNARKIDFTATNDLVRFVEYEGPKFVYSTRDFEENYLTFHPADILFEEVIKPQKIETYQWRAVEFFSFNGKPDLLGSVFYALVMYDEYLSESFDEHDRFMSKDSTLVKFGMLDKLMVERWSISFIEFLEEKLNTKLMPKNIPFVVIPTFDIDNTYAFKLKEGWRKWMSVGKDILSFNKKRLNERKGVLEDLKNDPYDTFEYIEDIAKRGFDVKIFWLLGDYAKYDRNISFHHPKHQRLIRKMSQFTTIGLHPSYRSDGVFSLINEEKKRMETILDSPVKNSRQHYLKMKLPQTYRSLIKCGFKNDYTLGFADAPGFRAGIARPFPWFDLKNNTDTDFILHPFTYMDGTLNEYQGLSIPEAKKKVGELATEVSKYGGNLIAIWHNETIGDYGKWDQWSDVLEYTLSFQKQEG
ncbi:MAG: hypothetical protein COA32_10595 [Fluviicola sp.]|nr:MAG: hypothetical protein COA32_10595 [Fluviicola sp.]